jgi:hypothetical protein
VTELSVVVPDICGPSAWKMLHITFLVPRFLKWLEEFWKICGTSVSAKFGYSVLEVLWKYEPGD